MKIAARRRNGIRINIVMTYLRLRAAC